MAEDPVNRGCLEFFGMLIGVMMVIAVIII